MPSSAWLAASLYPPLASSGGQYTVLEEEELATIGNMAAQKLEEQHAFKNRFLAGEEPDLFELEERFLNMASRRDGKANDVCVTKDAQIEFFDITIFLHPEGDEECSLADQYLLGNDLNLLLLEYGVGGAGAGDDIEYLAGVCSAPETTRRQLTHVKGYVYKGGGACRGCGSDDRDARGRLRKLVSSDWFENVFKPTMEASMEGAIANELVPNHLGCLGANPTVAVEVEGVSFAEVDVYCGMGDGIEMSVLDTIGHSDWVLRGSETSCGTCSKIDFSEDGDGNPLVRGDWLSKYAYADSHGVNIRVKGGYSPNPGEARIFDTAVPFIKGIGGDKDLGSPNEDCPGGGPEKGDAGAPGMEGENCVPLGNILVIQEDNLHLDNPDDSEDGGIVSIKFDEPVLFNDIGFVDADESTHRLRLTYSGGCKEGMFKYRGFGGNSVQRVIVDRSYVTKVEVIFEGSGAITEFNFCPVC